MKTEAFPPTFILRHRKERISKCSLRGLESRVDMRFFTYPLKDPIPSLTRHIVLTLDAPVLSKEDGDKGIFLIDGTWRYAEKMLASLPIPYEKRSLPPAKTAYPRKQTGCSNPKRGLASIEALYLAYVLLGRETEGLLDSYLFREEFLRRNPQY